MKYLHISIIWGGPAKSTDQLRPILDLGEDWIAIGVGTWILCSNEDIFVWQGRLRAVTNDNDVFLISEIANIKHCGGWLYKYTWDWINKDRGTTILPPLPPAFPQLKLK